MPAYYVKRAFEILREEGPAELYSASTGILLRRLDPYHHRRFKFYTWYNHLQNRIKYDAPPDPYQPIFIRPKQIEYRMKHEKNGLLKPRKDGLGQIKKGSWDSKEHSKSVDEIPAIHYFMEKHIENKNQEDTERYKQLKKKRRNDGKHREWGFETIKEYMSNYFDEYDRLYEKIENSGYKTNHKSPRLGRKRSQASVADRLEVQVVINREGCIHLFDGHHRFGIARALDIEIPAHVVCRHKQWQKLRDDIYNNGLPENREDLRDHPDLQDVIDD